MKTDRRAYDSWSTTNATALNRQSAAGGQAWWSGGSHKAARAVRFRRPLPEEGDRSQVKGRLVQRQGTSSTCWRRWFDSISGCQTKRRWLRRANWQPTGKTKRNGP